MTKPAKPTATKPSPRDSRPEDPASAQGDSVTSQLSKYLKETKEEHFNYEENIEYHVSSGSLNVDMEIEGFGPGVLRLGGPSQSGKSAFSLEVARNFLASIPNSRVVYFKAEGRLSEENKARTGLTFVEDPEQWANGNVFVFKTQIYEAVIGLMRDLVTANPTKTRYMFIIDSMDGLNLRSDFKKAIEEGNKVAGAPLLTKHFLQKLSLAMTQYGHMCFFLSQVSADIKIDPYAKSAVRQLGGSGGNAVAHFANEVLEFLQPYEGGLILEDPDARMDRFKNRAIGHVCKVKVQKSDKEVKFITVEIPIKHGQTKGGSVWREREIVDQMLVWGLITRAGSWTKVNAAFRTELSTAGFEVPEQFQGLDKLYGYLSENPALTAHLFARFKKLVGGTP